MTTKMLPSPVRNTKIVICKYNNYGYCKYQKHCNFIHSEDKCVNIHCKNSKCEKRHPKECRYKSKCRRFKTCSYRHETNHNELLENLKLQIVDLNKHVNDLTKLKEEKNEEIINIKDELKQIKEKIKFKDEEISRLNKDKSVIINDKNKIQNENDEIKMYKFKISLENASKDKKIKNYLN